MSLGKSFIFGKGQKASTPEELKKQRAILDAMAAKSYSPQNVPEGLAAIADALSYRFQNADYDKRLADSQAAGAANMAKITGALGGLFGGGVGGGAAAASSSSAAASGAGMTGDEIAWSEAKPYQKALLNTIAGPESGGRYNIVYGGGKFDDFSDHPRRDIRISTGPNANRTSSAAGKYQFLGSTWDDQKRKLGLPDFSPANQDKAAWNLAAETYKAKTGQDLDTVLQSGDPAALASVGKVLSTIWTSLPGGIEQGQGSDRFVSTFQKYMAAGATPAQAQQAAAAESGQAAPAAPAAPQTAEAARAAVIQSLQEQGHDINDPAAQATIDAKVAEVTGQQPLVQVASLDPAAGVQQALDAPAPGAVPVTNVQARPLAPGEPGASAAPMFQSPASQASLMAPMSLRGDGVVPALNAPPPPPAAAVPPPAAPGALPAVDIAGEQIHDVGGAAGRTAPLAAFPDASAGRFPPAPGAPVAAPGTGGAPQALGGVGGTGGLDTASLLALAADPNTPEYGRALVENLLKRQLDANDPDKIAERELRRLQMDKARQDVTGTTPLTAEQRYQHEQDARKAAQEAETHALDIETKRQALADAKVKAQKEGLGEVKEVNKRLYRYRPDPDKPGQLLVEDITPGGGASAVTPASQEDIGRMRDDFTKDKAVLDFRTSIPLYNSMLKSANIDTKAADLDLIYGMAKLMDPGSVVRTEEGIMVQGTGSVQDQVRGLLNMLNDQGRLPTGQRANLMEIAQNRINGYYEQYDSTRKVFGGIAQRGGADPRDVVRDFDPPAKWTPSGQQLPSPQTDEDFSKLQKGDHYIDPDDGKEYVK